MGIWAGWSEPLLVAHTTLLEISCRGSNGFQDQLSLNAGQKYCRMLQGSILQYFRPSLSYHLSLRFLFCLIFEWPVKTGFIVQRFYCTYRFPCEICSLEVSDFSRCTIFNKCEQWSHKSCLGMDTATYMYDHLMDTTDPWLCSSCKGAKWQSA